MGQDQDYRPLEAILASLTRAYLAYLPDTARMDAPGLAWLPFSAPLEALAAPVLGPSSAVKGVTSREVGLPSPV
jgi:hypothetical protein